MMRLNLVLLLGVLVSALYLVSVQYESRRLFSNLDKARAQARKLEVEKESLLVAKRAQATSMRVERLAKEQLKMQIATPAITHYVSYRAEPLPVAAGGDAVPARGQAGTAGRIQ